MIKLAVGVALLGSALMAKTTHPKTLEDQVRHEILTDPYIGVFDNPAFAIDNGVVTLLGEVNLYKIQLRTGGENREGRDPREQPDRSFAVIPVRRSDPLPDFEHTAAVRIAE
jgi:hypothetical protein